MLTTRLPSQIRNRWHNVGTTAKEAALAEYYASFLAKCCDCQAVWDMLSIPFSALTLWENVKNQQLKLTNLYWIKVGSIDRLIDWGFKSDSTQKRSFQANFYAVLVLRSDNNAVDVLLCRRASGLLPADGADGGPVSQSLVYCIIWRAHNGRHLATRHRGTVSTAQLESRRWSTAGSDDRNSETWSWSTRHQQTPTHRGKYCSSRTGEVLLTKTITEIENERQISNYRERKCPEYCN